MQNNRGENWLCKLDSKIAENSKLSLFLLLQIFIIGLLVIGYIKMVDKIQVNVELPKTIKETGEIYIGKEYANETFFRMWGREDVEIISNFNQKSIKEKMEYLKNRMYPPSYYKYVMLLKKYEKQISTDLISQNFIFAKENIKINVSSKGNEAVVEIPGFYNKTIDEDMIIKAQPCKYELGYLIEGGHIYVKTFKTNCK